jgi:tetratricopeptide (TPR) repeat protein
MGGKRTRKRKSLCLCFAGLMFLPLLSCATSEEVRERNEAREFPCPGQERLAQGEYEGSLLENQYVLSLPEGRSCRDEALFNMGLIYAHSGNPEKDFRKSMSYFEKLVQDYPESPFAEQAKIWVATLQEIDELHGGIEKSTQTIKQSGQDMEKLNEALQAALRKLEEPPATAEPPPGPETDKQAEARDVLLRAQDLLAQGEYDRAFNENERLLGSGILEDEALFNLGMICIHSGNPKRDSVKSQGFLKKLIKDYPQSPWSDRAKVVLGVFQENEKLTQDIEKLKQVFERSKQVDIEIEEKRREKIK